MYMYSGCICINKCFLILIFLRNAGNKCSDFASVVKMAYVIGAKSLAGKMRSSAIACLFVCSGGHPY